MTSRGEKVHVLEFSSAAGVASNDWLFITIVIAVRVRGGQRHGQAQFRALECLPLCVLGVAGDIVELFGVRERV